MKKLYSLITGTGSSVPLKVVRNDDFLNYDFLESTGEKIDKENREIVDKFEEITTISERRYAEDHQTTSDLALEAAEKAIESAGIEREELDYVILAHNFGDTKVQDTRIDVLPSLASRVKAKLGIQNPNAVAYDVLFGCPGWVQALIQADYYIRSGDAKKVLVIGADVLSRISDPHDRDSMIYADGAGAAVVEAVESETPVGILGHNSRSDAIDYVNLLHMGYSYNKELAEKKDLYLKMNGRRLYQYALENVPKAIKSALDKLKLHVNDVKKVLIHQANGKMDDAILKRLFKLYNLNDIPESLMPMTISWLGNSSVATVPTLLDMVMRGEMNGHDISSGDNLVLASVGAGMNINSVIYRMP
ncbi:3-oxoacyl-ACP synthase III family protein [Petrimonas sp.]|uniref:3-oxoacyl-ACP synthase III family protein n=1 Tax=Petrimonas sp. TaxID=2023866 RepID=UPI003F51035D